MKKSSLRTNYFGIILIDPDKYLLTIIIFINFGWILFRCDWKKIVCRGIPKYYLFLIRIKQIQRTNIFFFFLRSFMDSIIKTQSLLL